VVVLICEQGDIISINFDLSKRHEPAGRHYAIEEACVYGVDGSIIKNLYAAGNIQGNKFNVQYPIAMEGAASGLCMYYGYVAGKNAANGV
jgi:predicted oxidoreductase